VFPSELKIKHTGNMKSKFQILAAGVLTALLVGCASTGSNFDETRASQIKKGETTEAELVQWFGQPQNRSANSEGQTILTWMYVEANAKGTSFIPIAGAFMGGTDSKTKTLTAVLQNGTVQSYTSSGGGMETRHMTQEAPKQ
jgi:hypothetical protein